MIGDDSYETDRRLRALEGSASTLTIQSGLLTSSPDGNGVFSVTFPTAFASNPVIMVMIQVNTSANEYSVFLNTKSTTGFTARQQFNGAAHATGKTIHWIAMDET